MRILKSHDLCLWCDGVSLHDEDPAIRLWLLINNVAVKINNYTIGGELANFQLTFPDDQSMFEFMLWFG